MSDFSINVTADSVAWYGAIVATFSFIISSILGILSYLRDKASIKVKKSEGFLVYSNSLSEEIYVFLEAINKGRRTVTLENVGVKLCNGSNLYFIEQDVIKFPYELGEGKSVKFWFDKYKIIEDIKKNNTKIKYAWFKDATGKIYKTKVNLSE